MCSMGNYDYPFPRLCLNMSTLIGSVADTTQDNQSIRKTTATACVHRPPSSLPPRALYASCSLRALCSSRVTKASHNIPGWMGGDKYQKGSVGPGGLGKAWSWAVMDSTKATVRLCCTRSTVSNLVAFSALYRRDGLQTRPRNT